MPTYTLKIEECNYWFVEVEADDEAQAEDMGHEMWHNGDLQGGDAVISVIVED